MNLLAQAAEGVGSANTAEVVFFWVFAVLALGAGIAVVTMRNIVHGALMLVLNLLAIAGLFLTLESSFLSIIQVLVYAGAIMVLFLFVIMLLGVSYDDLALETHRRTRLLAVLAGVVLASGVIFAFVGPYTSSASICGADTEVAASSDAVRCIGLADAYAEDDGAGVAFLGERMFTRYTFPFELSALLLTVATIGAVILARRRDLAPEDEDDRDPAAGPDDGPDTLGEAGTDVTAETDAAATVAASEGAAPPDVPQGDVPDDREA